MKHLALIALILLSAASAKAEEYKFPPDVLELIELYGGTADPLLPDEKTLEEIDDGFSFPPARLHLPVNVIINKRETTLYVCNVFGDTLDSYRVCCSAVRGQKRKTDDMRTPEGTFSIIGIYNSSDWRYKGTGDKCYGPYFVSLYTPGFYGIGIHGTNAPYSIPGRRSHGCIRLLNENICKLKQWLTKDSKVTILPDDPVQEQQAIQQIKSEYVGPRVSASGHDSGGTGITVDEQAAPSFRSPEEIPEAKDTD